MAFDFQAVADAIAVRFGPTVVNAPSGETAITLSTATLPAVVPNDQVVFVFPPVLDLSYGPSLRKATAEYPVRFYIYKVRDTPRNTALLYKWLGAFYATLDGQVHLGLSTYVHNAVVGNISVGELTYGDTKFHGLEFSVFVHMGEGVSATA